MGLAGIQALHTSLGPPSGHYMARLAKRWQDLRNMEAASLSDWQGKNLEVDLCHI